MDIYLFFICFILLQAVESVELAFGSAPTLSVLIHAGFNGQGISTSQERLPAVWNNACCCIKLLFANSTAGYRVIHLPEVHGTLCVCTHPSLRHGVGLTGLNYINVI